MEENNNASEQATFTVNPSSVLSAEEANKLDRDIRKRSEDRYIEIVSSIVSISKDQLKDQSNNKKDFRHSFGLFFGIFISVQYIALVVFMILSASCSCFFISDDLIKVYIVSVFVETLGVVAVMVRFAFDTKQEVSILSTLNSIVEHFQKYNR